MRMMRRRMIKPMSTAAIIKNGDCLQELPKLEENSIDLIVTDPPYAIQFMNIDWDKVTPSVQIWKECLRVLKPGAFAFIMSSPRQDVLSQMIVKLQEAGFETNFTSLYWTYANGFPKAGNIGKLIDRRNGRSSIPEFREYLNERRKAEGITQKEVNIALGLSVSGGGMASHYLTRGSQLELPRSEHYKKLKKLLKLDDRFDELIERKEAERKIIGKKLYTCPKGHVFREDRHNVPVY